jgi:hypothetical protein
MGSYNSTVITSVGQALLASAIANQKDVVFSKFQVSDHVYPAGTDLSALTSLQSVQKETAPSGASVYDSTTIHSSATVDNSGVLSEFNANTLGLFITVDSTEVLFGVSTAITPDVFPKDVGGVPSTYTYSMNLVVSSTENVTISVDMDAYLTAADVVDNLITDNPTAPLSARQGKVLKEMSSQALKVEWVGETTEKAYPINTVIYYGNKFMKVIKTGGLPINYTILPADLEDADLDPKTIVTVEGMPASEALNAADIDYSNTTSGASATNVQGAIDEAFSDLSELEHNTYYAWAIPHRYSTGVYAFGINNPHIKTTSTISNLAIIGQWGSYAPTYTSFQEESQNRHNGCTIMKASSDLTGTGNDYPYLIRYTIE